jgi:hypothetical protein
VVIERDARHGSERPLRLGLDAEEGLRLLVRARKSAERFLAGSSPDVPASAGTTTPRRRRRGPSSTRSAGRPRTSGSPKPRVRSSLSASCGASRASCETTGCTPSRCCGNPAQALGVQFGPRFPWEGRL